MTNHREDGEFGEGATVADVESRVASYDIATALHRRDGDGLAAAIDRLITIRVSAAIEDVLEAMREPTDAMVDAGSVVRIASDPGTVNSLRTWHAMILEALK